MVALFETALGAGFKRSTIVIWARQTAQTNLEVFL